MRALVFGYGRSGKAAEALLCRLGFTVSVLDGEATFPDGDFEVAVVSPGVPLVHPWIIEAKRRGIPLKSELQLGCEELRRRGWKLLAVTGSKGKSSVVKVVADGINLAGLHAVACGNYGLPVCEVAVTSETLTTNSQQLTAKYAVVEVSSFMMETTELPSDAFEAAAILNLQEDHLDRHGSVEVYHALKLKLLKFAVNAISERTVPASDWLAGSYFDNEILRSNGKMAIALMRVAGLGEATIRRAFTEFVPLAHRMNRVATIDGVDYIDDSKATSLAALAAGVRMASGSRRSAVRLIAGGLPKGDDPKAVLPVLTAHVVKVYLIGRSAEAFADAWKSHVDCEICDTIDRAVAAVKRDAEKGDTVLLSPGTASFDQFKSFGERGDAFSQLVKKEYDNE